MQKTKQKEMKRQEKENWAKKVIVDNTVFKTYMQANQRKKISDFDKIDGLLHDPPKHKGLKFDRT